MSGKTETLTREAHAAAPVGAVVAKETPEDVKKRARKPPKDGPCKRCGKNKPLNRLMLCYECWVKENLERSGWHEGEPHPPGCGCAISCQKGGQN